MEGLGGDGGGKLRSALRTQADCGTTYEHTTCAQRDALRVALRVRGGIEMATKKKLVEWLGGDGGLKLRFVLRTEEDCGDTYNYIASALANCETGGRGK